MVTLQQIKELIKSFGDKRFTMQESPLNDGTAIVFYHGEVKISEGFHDDDDFHGDGVSGVMVISEEHVMLADVAIPIIEVINGELSGQFPAPWLHDRSTVDLKTIEEYLKSIC